MCVNVFKSWNMAVTLLKQEIKRCLIIMEFGPFLMLSVSMFCVALDRSCPDDKTLFEQIQK